MILSLSLHLSTQHATESGTGQKQQQQQRHVEQFDLSLNPSKLIRADTLLLHSALFYCVRHCKTCAVKVSHDSLSAQFGFITINSIPFHNDQMLANAFRLHQFLYHDKCAPTQHACSKHIFYTLLSSSLKQMCFAIRYEPLCCD